MGFTLFIEHLDTGTMAQRDALAAGDGDESYEPIHLQKRGTTNNDREKGGRGLERTRYRRFVSS